MVNHVRNLLLNVGKAGASPFFPGEEYVPAAFLPRRLTGDLRLIRSVLFGVNPDRAFLNFRCRQYLTLMHQSRLAHLIEAVDSRVTYWPFADDWRGDSVTVRAIGHAAPLAAVRGSATCDPGAGVSLRRWRIRVIDASTGTVQPQQPLDAAKPFEYSTESGVSAEIALPGSGLTFRLSPGASGKQWSVDARARPDDAVLPRLAAAADAVGLGKAAALVAAGPADGRDVWHHGTTDADRYAAFLFAYAYAVDGAAYA